MEKIACISCQKTKAGLECVSCKEALCKSCAQFVDEHSFSFLDRLPEGFEAGSYCIQCYDVKAQPVVAAYEEKVERARNLSVYMKNQGKEVTALKRAQHPVEVEDCEDREEALLRLAFLAVEEGYDTLIKVEITSKKIRTGSYQKAVWGGTGVPAARRERRK